MLHLEKLGALGDRHDPAVVVSITRVVEFRFLQLPNSALAPLNHNLEHYPPKEKILRIMIWHLFRGDFWAKVKIFY